MYYDWTMLLIIPGLLLGLWAQSQLQHAYQKYGKIPAAFGGTAAQAARYILDQSGNDNVAVEAVPGTLTDHYDPRGRVLRLSEGVYSQGSLAALGIAAHEAGHAMQHKEGYAWLGLRSACVPAVNIGSNLAMPIFVAGLIFSVRFLQTAGIALFSLVVLFSIITLPVEFDASRRAVRALESSGLIAGQEESRAVRTVLRAAAMTYVAGAVSAALQLLRLIILSRRRDD